MSDEDDALRKMAERLDKLEAKVRYLNEMHQRSVFHNYELQRRLWRAKLEPRLFEFLHYPPRELKPPAWYAKQVALDKPPTIAIVTPSYNQGDYIGATIDSVQGQGYPALRYVVKDGGSTDNTCSVLASHGDTLQWQSKRDAGQTAAINEGFRLVSGEIMAYLNSDDILLPGTLSYVAHAFHANPQVDLIYGHRIIIDDVGREVGRWVLPPHDPHVLKWIDYIPQETLFWRKRVWDAVGPFDETFAFAMDWDFILRSQAAGFQFKRMPRFLAGFRVHPEQKTSAQKAVGDKEQDRLRKTHLGWEPSPERIWQETRGYIRRHVLYHRLYKAGLFKY